MLNQTFDPFDKIELRAMEHLLWCLVILSKSLKLGSEVVFKLKDSSELRGYVHKDWMERPPEVKATCIDVKATYKQLALHPDEYRRTVVSLFDVASNRPSCIISDANSSFKSACQCSQFLESELFQHGT